MNELGCGRFLGLMADVGNLQSEYIDRLNVVRYPLWFWREKEAAAV